MDYPYGAPPPSSSGALRSLQPDFPEEGQPTVGVASAPTYSTGLIRSSDQQFAGVGQRALPPYESVLPPPGETAVRTLQHSTNQLTTGDGNRGYDETYGAGGGGFSGLVHQNYSSNDPVDYGYNTGDAPGLSGYVKRDRSSSGSYNDNTTSDSLPNARHSMTGNKFKNAYKLFNQFDS